jgi:hypothetical protein
MCWLLCLFRHVVVLVSNLLCLISSIGITFGLKGHGSHPVIVIHGRSLKSQ